MCGISAIIDLKNAINIETSLNLMSDCQSHRGPDGSGKYISEDRKIGLAHRRLAIIDLSPSGSQPMFDSKTDTYITFNGEIYNYKTLRKTLENLGEIFDSSSDTEVLLKGLSKLGPDFLNHIDGQFAFVFYNSKSNEIIAGRDRFGEKPLYMYTHNSLFAFSSELNALEKLNVSLTLSKTNLQDFLLFQYFPINSTPYNEVTKIPPGNFVLINSYGQMVIDKFGSEFNFESRNVLERISLDDAANRVQEILTESIRLRLESSDVQVGAFLSGGIDSSLVVALATKNLNIKLSTFSIGFNNDINSEHEIARNISKMLGTNHVDKIIDLDINTFIRDVIPRMDEPHGDFSNYPTYELCKLASKSVKVAISGDGGDELFSGYDRYRVPFYKSKPDKSVYTGEDYYSDSILTGDLADITQLFGTLKPERLVLLRKKFDAYKNNVTTLDATRLSDIENYLPGAILQKVDRMSMLNSLEVRTPFLQADLFRLAFNLPDEMHINQKTSKVILRYLLSKFLDKSITSLPKKGFGLPSASWGQEAIMQEINNTLKNRNSPIFEFVDYYRFVHMYNQMSNNPNLYKPLLLWNIIILNHWLSERIN